MGDLSFTERLRRSVEDALLDYTVVPSFGSPGFKLRQRRWDRAATEVDMTDRVCVVTGANSGIGKATAVALAQRGATVVMACRDRDRAEAARVEVAAAGGEAIVELLDVSSLASVRAFASRVEARFAAVDVLVNNAGAMIDSRRESVDGIELSFATNVLGGWLLTKLLTPALARSKPGGRVVHVSSGGMYLAGLELDDPQWQKRTYDDVRAYAENKRAQVVLNIRWAKVLAPFGVVSNAMHPGWVETPGVSSALPRFERLMMPLLRTPAEGADTIVWLAVADAATRLTGRFVFDRKVRQPHITRRTRETPQQRGLMWQMCEALAAS